MQENDVVVVEPKEETINLSDYESMGMTPKDMKEFFNWALGSTSEPPDVVQKMMNNLSAKLSVGLGINIVGNIGRQTRLTQFLEEMEKDIYDVNKITEMSEKEKLSAYKEARSTLNSLTEIQRKFIAQSKDLKPEGSEQEKLLGRIMALPKDKLAMIISILDDNPTAETKVTEEPESLFPDNLDEVED